MKNSFVPTKEEVEKARIKLIAGAKKSPEYRALMRRRYRTPQGYSDYAEVALDLAGHYYSLKHVPAKFLSNETAFAENIVFFLAGYIAKFQSPVYWLAEPLLEAMLQTQLPTKIVAAGLKRPIPAATIMLPKGKIYSPDNEQVTYLSFAHTLKDEPTPVFLVGNQKIAVDPAPFDSLSFATTVERTTIYASNSGLYADDSGELDRGDWKPSEVFSLTHEELNPEEIELDFLKKLESIVLQTILFLQTRPDFLEMGDTVGFGGAVAKQRNPQKQCNLLLNPNWIGRNYQPKREHLAPQGTHASPRTHWRTGHHRRVAVGEGRQERRWHWFEPVLVNG